MSYKHISEIKCDEFLNAYLKQNRFNLWLFRFGLLNKHYKEFRDGFRAGWFARELICNKEKEPHGRE
jgi:hypothetical protein